MNPDYNEYLVKESLRPRNFQTNYTFSKIKFWKSPSNDRCLIALNSGESLSFHGAVSLRVLVGAVSVFGAVRSAKEDGTPSSPFCVYAPYSSPALTLFSLNELHMNEIETALSNIKNLRKCFDNSISDHINEILNRYKSDIILYETFETQKSKDVKFRSPESLSAIVLIEEIKKDNFSEPVFTVEDVPQFCFDLSAQHVVQTKLQFNVEEDNDETVATKKQRLDCFFNDDIISLNHFHVIKKNYPSFQFHPSLLLTALAFLDKPAGVISVIGNKGVGKSTSMRFIINTLLNKYDSVLLFDTDVGQSELTPSGIVALKALRTAHVGPPFSRRTFGGKMFYYGDCTSERDPVYYLRIIKQIEREREAIVREESKSGSSVFTVVNMSGWIQGIGKEELLAINNIIHPEYVVFITNETRTLDEELLYQSLIQEDNFPEYFKDYEKELSAGGKYNPFIITIPTYSPTTQNLVQLTSAELRAISSTVYFKDSFSGVNDAVVYDISWDDVFIAFLCDDIAPSQSLFALNGSIVGLCTVNGEFVRETNDTPKNESAPQLLRADGELFPCVGLGIVQWINTKERTFGIRTPLSVEQLRTVNVLVKGGPVDLPYQSSSFSFVPERGIVSPCYVSSGLLRGDGTGGSAMKSRSNIKRN